MTNKLYEKQDVIEMINAGKSLILAGDENVLKDLPAGQWIAGTIPYFMDKDGGITSSTGIFVTELPECVLSSSVKVYDDKSVKNVYADGPSHGFGVVIIPAMSQTHSNFALDFHSYEDFAAKPLIGWISGVLLDDLGKVTPKVFDGTTKKIIEDGAVVLNVELPENKYADIEIVNLFEQKDGDTITFPENGFNAQEVFVNGEKTNFADYLIENNIDTKLPLVANMCGAMINTSFQAVNEAEKKVDFYAPVFQGVNYKIAAQTEDYVKTFSKNIPDGVSDTLFFSCNCILNYLYAELEGKKTKDLTGPITFGEIAYQLLNQTMAYVTIEDA